MTSDTPVAFFVFKRPVETRTVLQKIKDFKPRRLFIVADGPRDIPDEIKACDEVRRVVENIDWDCEVFRNFSECNMGCRSRMTTGLAWVFSIVEEAIILEDDCLPDLTFFRYCHELLNKFRDNDEISLISANKFSSVEVTESYTFSKYPHIWGWATWRRTWRNYDVHLSSWDRDRNSFLTSTFHNPKVAKIWGKILDSVHRGKIDTWDYQLAFSILKNKKLCIVPKHNLVKNLGFGRGATNTKFTSRYYDIKPISMDFPLVHPSEIKQNLDADLDEEETLLKEQNSLRHLTQRFCAKINALISQK